MRGRDSLNSIPQSRKQGGEEGVGGVPDKALTLEQLGGLSGEDCLDLIEERHGLLAETLFTGGRLPAPTAETGKWDRENLPKVALMRLEGLPPRTIADFFSQEFSLLHRTDTLVSANTVSAIMNSYFSPELKQKISAYEEERASGKILLLENRDLILEIVKKTGLKVPDLFSGKTSLGIRNSNAMFTPLEVIKAFAMRLENKHYEDILAAIGKTYSPELRGRLGMQITQTFSEDARRFLPNERTRERNRRAETE